MDEANELTQYTAEMLRTLRRQDHVFEVICPAIQQRMGGETGRAEMVEIEETGEVIVNISQSEDEEAVVSTLDQLKILHDILPALRALHDVLKCKITLAAIDGETRLHLEVDGMYIINDIDALLVRMSDAFRTVDADAVVIPYFLYYGLLMAAEKSRGSLAEDE